MPIEDLEVLEEKLRKRGFKQSDIFHHECPVCHEQAVRIYSIIGRSGGRDIRLCLACGDSRSWRSVAGMEQRSEDAGFDLRKFLG
jgi:hypothetical protein